ncbi:hypothetical protein [Nodosilinea sp. P-1105]|uniref:hypothetical protein n=1 Tax=Nodosilinea sp. P-1105 TaxID=2546229 RepID=UPI00146E2B1C|nr:hypothetical protein [Nodosilinea sp. P-1105]NMF86042.1 hypothetical protein [Nodosilinea sp. P-1105]
MKTLHIWTTEQLTRFSLWLGQAFNPYALAPNPRQGGDVWTSDRLTHMGLALSRGFGSGL